MTWPVEATGWDVEQAWVQSSAHSLASGIFGWGVGVAVLLCVASDPPTAWSRTPG